MTRADKGPWSCLIHHGQAGDADYHLLTLLWLQLFQVPALV